MTGGYGGGAGSERAGHSRAAAVAQLSQVAGTPRQGSVTVGDAAASLTRLANVAAGLNAAYASSARRGAQTAVDHAAAQRRDADRQVGDGAVRAAELARTALEPIVGSLAPGVLSAPWDDIAALSTPAQILDAAAYVRSGTVRLEDTNQAPRVEAPLLLPLLDHGNILICAPCDHPGVGGLVQEIILRSLLGTGAGQLSLSTYDPHLRGTTAPFTALRQVSEELVPLTLASPGELRSLLEELSRDVRRISEMYEGVPTTLGQFRRDARQPIERYRLVTLLNYPAGFDESADGLLRTLMRTGPACGVSFVVHHDTTMAQPDDVMPDGLYPLASVVRIGNPTRIDDLPGFVADLGTAPPLAVIEPAIHELRERAKEAAAPKISFSELQPPADGYWHESSAERVTAVIGRVGHQPVEITLGDEREQRHNLLVSGAVGQGKSNLLMVLVHSWAVRYAPSELDLYLLDFKDGVTLYPLAPHPAQQGWLPHCRVLGLESDRAFGAAVLQYLVDEFERRASAIRPYGDNITRFRQLQPDAHMPRIIVVIDEFQVLFEEDDDLTRGSLLNLERLAKKGRAYGIHLVLASQTLSGITAMLSKQDGIFAQFPIRLALKNSGAESRAVLDQQNTEAARLRYRGELIVNADFGQVDANRRAVVALADPTELAQLRSELWRRTTEPTVPIVFNGAVPADLLSALDSLTSAPDGEPRALLGLPVAVTPAPVGVEFPADSGRHLSIIGAGDSAGDVEQSAGAVMLQGAAVSLARQHDPASARFIVINLLSPKSKDQVTVSRLQRALRALGHTPELVTGGRLAERLGALGREVAARRDGAPTTATYVIAFGMDRAASLRTFDLAAGTQPIDALHAIWREGSQLGIHLLGWWVNIRTYNDQVGMEASGMVDAVAALRISNQDVLDLFGPFVTWNGPTNRALFRDVVEATDPTVIVPFAPLRDVDIDRLTREAVPL